MQKNIVINGRPLTGTLNGIPRYVREITRHLDRLIDDTYRVEVVIPEGRSCGTTYQNIRLVSLPQGLLWDYSRVEAYARRQNALYVNLGSRGVWYRHSIATIHDICPLRFGNGKLSWNSAKAVAKFTVSYQLAIHRAGQRVTVSDFSRDEIADYSGISKDRIEVIGNGWEHMDEIQEDVSIFQEYPKLQDGAYFLSVSSIAPNKNFPWIMENAKRHPECLYVIVGKTNPSVWADMPLEDLDNVIYVGFQSDERMKALLMRARALVFPSVYEGFGIPPLEALACGTPAVVSDIPVMREIYKDSVCYIDPMDADVDLDTLMKAERGDAAPVLQKYTWDNAATKLMDLIRRMSEDA